MHFYTLVMFALTVKLTNPFSIVPRQGQRPLGSSSIIRALSATPSSSPSPPPPAPDSGNPVNWYPGHISSAENKLSSTLKSVDCIIEVRDSRCPLSTSHPSLTQWSLGCARVVVLSKADMVPEGAKKGWARDNHRPLKELRPKDVAMSKHEQFLVASRLSGPDSPETRHMFLNLMKDPLHNLKKQVTSLGSPVLSRRASRGLLPRPLRVAVVGYPNVGKSALINKLLGRNRLKSANTPGVTRQLHWVKVRQSSSHASTSGGVVTGSKSGDSFELLDTPGIIPQKLVDQRSACHLACCGLVGEKGYDSQTMAAYFLARCRWLLAVGCDHALPDFRASFKKRYGFDIDDDEVKAEDLLWRCADNICFGDLENAGRRVLGDFRKGRFGKVALEVPESEAWEEREEGQGAGVDMLELELEEEEEDESEKRARAEEEGVALPDEGGGAKGPFDGW